MSDFSMMWVGNPLTQVQRLCMRSFLHHGHQLTLYSYQDLDAPDGVVIADANDIIKESDIFSSHDTFAAFADVFRYHLLASRPTIWVDADTLCLKKDWDFGEYLFGYQEEGKIVNSVLSYPTDSSLAMMMKSRAVYHPDNAFDELGPVLLTTVLNEIEMTHLAQPASTFSPIPWQDFGWMWNESQTAQVLHLSEDSHAISLWNYMLGYHNIDRNTFPLASAMWYWNRKFSE